MYDLILSDVIAIEDLLEFSDLEVSHDCSVCGSGIAVYGFMKHIEFL